MSKGIGAWARLIFNDENVIIYEYSSYNLNIKEYTNKNKVLDGRIIFKQECFPEPLIKEKIKKAPNGNKTKIKKFIFNDIDYIKMINDSKIIIINCSNCWYTIGQNEIDSMAYNIIFKLFEVYKKEATIPDYISYNV